MPRKEITGKVVSNKMDKTVVVAVDLRVPHVRYEKQRLHTSKFKAHDEQNKYQVGDIVRIRECRPLSKDKRWVVIDVSGHVIPEIEPTEADIERAEALAKKAKADAAEKAAAAVAAAARAKKEEEKSVGGNEE